MKNTSPKIVGLYQCIFVKKNTEEINWSEFFLIKPNIPGLVQVFDSVLSNFTEDSLLQRNISILLAKCTDNIEQQSSIVKTNNACVTLAVLIEKLSATPNFDIVSIFTENVLQNLCQCLCQKLSDAEITDETTKKCLIKLIFVISCCKSDIWKNKSLSYFSEDDLVFETLSCVFAQPQLYGQYVLECSMKVMVALLFYTDTYSMDNGIISRLSVIQDNFVLKSITDYIESWISRQNTKYETALVEPALVSSLSSKVFNLFSNDDGSQSRINICPQEIICVAFLPCQRHCIYCSFQRFFIFSYILLVYFSDFKSDLSKENAKMCLLIIWNICSDSFGLSIVHDQQMFSPVSLYHPASLKRRASFDHQNSAITIALCECIFSLLTDFSNYHLMLKFPFEHYHIMLSIVHKILIYQKRTKFRIKQWNAPFDALIKLIDYISRHFVRLGDLSSFQASLFCCLLIKTKRFQLANRALIVINFFITYGDNFLPDTIAYDFLYYEIARQSEVFCRLNSIAESTQASVQTGSSLGELSGRLINQLTNILAIVRHIRPKLESHSLLDPNAEEVIKIVQESFEDLTLKLYEGMETIERCENVDCQRYLFSIVENTMGRVKVSWSQENSVL
uniref:Armadillo-like helical domain-containing protein n=1 Tax=Ditylenchus dipsaci TaxID=166011 RepID=A0A915E2T1_9BILA